MVLREKTNPLWWFAPSVIFFDLTSTNRGKTCVIKHHGCLTTIPRPLLILHRPLHPELESSFRDTSLHLDHVSPLPNSTSSFSNLSLSTFYDFCLETFYRREFFVFSVSYSSFHSVSSSSHFGSFRSTPLRFLPNHHIVRWLNLKHGPSYRNGWSAITSRVFSIQKLIYTCQYTKFLVFHVFAF